MGSTSRDDPKNPRMKSPCVLWPVSGPRVCVALAGAGVGEMTDVLTHRVGAASKGVKEITK